MFKTQPQRTHAEVVDLIRGTCPGCNGPDITAYRYVEVDGGLFAFLDIETRCGRCGKSER